MKLAVETCKQLRGICNRNEMNLASSPANTVNIRRALISGMFVNSAEHFKDNEYKTVTTIISVLLRFLFFSITPHLSDSTLVDNWPTSGSDSSVVGSVQLETFVCALQRTSQNQQNLHEVIEKN